MANKVLDYFYQITKIPRESGNELGMQKFLQNFAKANNFECVVDENKNVLIRKNVGNKKPLLLQAHTDMVCVKDLNCNIDFSKDEIKTIVKDNVLSAVGTSLGADNGIGLCMILSLLQESFDMNIEAVFTSEEETTMNGAKTFDENLLKAKHMLSIDGSCESTIEASSASMSDVEIKLAKSKILAVSKNIYEFSVDGLLGGHSGADVDKNRGNAFLLGFNFLNQISDLKLINLKASVKANVLPTNFYAQFETSFSREQLESLLAEYYMTVSNNFYAPNFKMQLNRVEELMLGQIKAYENTKELLSFINELQIGVVKEDENSNVLLSANLFEVNLDEEVIGISVRANQKHLEENYLDDMEAQANFFGHKYNLKAYLPMFEFNANSVLRDALVKTHQKLYGKAPKIQNIHAGLEGGIFADKIPGLDINVIAPNIYDMHSVNERVEIDSIQRTYNWLVELVKEF